MKKAVFITLLSLNLIFIFSASAVKGQIPGLPSVRSKPAPQKPVVPTNDVGSQQAEQSPSSRENASTQVNEYPKHFFFTTAEKATDKILKAKDLVACIFGSNANPSNKDAFKKVVPTVGGQKGRVIDAGTCDVVVLVVQNAEAEKNLKRDNEGFAVYKIVGDDLELLFKPEAGQHIAVGKMELAKEQTLNKSDITACGDSSLRNSYRPNPDTWKNWGNQYMDEAQMANLTVNTSPLGRRCDVWIMTPELYKSFVKKFGGNYPLFDVSPSSPQLTRKR